MLAGNAAEPLIALGEWDRAAAMIDRALELDPPAHHHAHLRLLRAWLNVWRGDLEEADAMLIEFRPMITDVQPSPQYVSYAIRADAEYALAVGDHRTGLGRRLGLLRSLGHLSQLTHLPGARGRRRGRPGP